MKILYLFIIPVFYSFSPKPNNHNFTKSEKKIVVDAERYCIDFQNLLGFYRDTNYLFWEDKKFICYYGLCYLNNDNSYLNMCFDFGPKEKTFKESLGPILKRGYIYPNEKLITTPLYKEIEGKGLFLQESILNLNNKSYHVFLCLINLDPEVTFKIRLTYNGNGEDIRKKVYKMLISFRIIRYNKNTSCIYYCG